MSTIRKSGDIHKTPVGLIQYDKEGKKTSWPIRSDIIPVRLKLWLQADNQCSVKIPIRRIDIVYGKYGSNTKIFQENTYIAEWEPLKDMGNGIRPCVPLIFQIDVYFENYVLCVDNYTLCVQVD
jgi:hypothetical protein